MDQQLGRPVLIEFWDFCRANSLRTLPYMRGVARALRGGRAARDLRARRRLPAVARSRAGARGGRAAGDRAPGRCSTRTSSSGASTATRPGRRATSSTSACGCSRCTTARAPTTETQAEICELLGSSRPSRWRPLRPEDEPGALVGRPTAEQAGAWSGPVRGGRRVGGARAAARRRCADAAVRANGRDDRGRPRRLLSRSSSTSATRPACSSSRSATACAATPCSSRLA